MSTPVNKAVLFRNQLFISTSEKTSGPVLFVGVQGIIFYIKSDKAGKVRIDIRVDDQWEELVEDPVRAAKMHIINIPFYIPEARARFEPDAADTTLRTITAIGYPSVYVREDLSSRGERDQYSTPG